MQEFPLTYRSEYEWPLEESDAFIYWTAPGGGTVSLAVQSGGEAVTEDEWHPIVAQGRVVDLPSVQEIAQPPVGSDRSGSDAIAGRGPSS